MYHRFELYIGDEKQDVGLLMGISELDCLDDERLDFLMKNFDEKLVIPKYYLENNHDRKNVRAYFTEKGLEFFKKDINNLIYEFEKQGLFDIKELLLEENDANIVYQDEFQVLAKTNE